MSILNSNLMQYNISSEAELSNILSNFNEDMIYNIVQDNIDQRFNYYQLTLPNLVSSYEANFKNLLLTYPDNSQIINQTRNNVYANIINILCSNFKLSISIDEDSDLYSIAFILYKFLVSEYRLNVVNFFVNFISKEKNNIYDVLSLNDKKKNKDSSTAYNKKVFKNVKLAVITANLEYVMNNICILDISFEDLVNIIYTYDKNISKTILSIVVPNTNFFKDNIVPIINSNIAPIIMTDIRITLHSIYVSKLSMEQYQI